MAEQKMLDEEARIRMEFQEQLNKAEKERRKQEEAQRLEEEKRKHEETKSKNSRI